MRHPKKEREEKLALLASKQAGYFTAMQAKSLGYATSAHTYHVKNGHWLRVDKGLYRLPGFSDNSMAANFARWSLWASNRKGEAVGVISHYSALAHYGLSDYDEKAVHLTVPKDFFKARADDCVLHTGNIDESDIIECAGYRVTSSSKTLKDMEEFTGRYHNTLLHDAEKAGLTQNDKEKLNSKEDNMATDNTQSGNGQNKSAPKMSAVKSRRKSGLGSQAAFTLVELLVVIAIISILAAMLMPALQKSLSSARQIQCSGNMKQVMIGVFTYTDDYDSYLPPQMNEYTNGTYRPFWHQKLESGSYTPKSIYYCPEMQKDSFEWNMQTHFGLNNALSGYDLSKNYVPDNETKSFQISSAKGASRKVYIMDSYRNSAAGDADTSEGFFRVTFSSSQYSNIYYGRPARRHDTSCNIAWLDGHTSGVNIASQESIYILPPFDITTCQENLRWY